jgi:hypothetical protein
MVAAAVAAAARARAMSGLVRMTTIEDHPVEPDVSAQRRLLDPQVNSASVCARQRSGRQGPTWRTAGPRTNPGRRSFTRPPTARCESFTQA